MADNAPETPGSPAWWMKRLTDRQTRRLNDSYLGLEVVPGLLTLDAWMSNRPPLPESAPEWLPAYQSFYASTRTNYAALPVISAAERMTPLGFRTGAADDDNGDDLAARFWAENQMPIEQVDLITWMLSRRIAYTMVGPPPSGSTVPVITVEDPFQVMTAHDPMRRHVVRAAIKTLHDPDEEIDVCYVYIAGENGSRATSTRAWKPAGRGSQFGSDFRFSPRTWRWDPPTQLATDKVPIVAFENRGGVAEFEPHLSLLDRLNRTVLQRMLIGELQAFRQRAVKGLPEVYPLDYPVAEMRGKQIDYKGIFEPGPGSLWQVPEGVDFWESQPIDLRPLLEAERLDVRTYSALTRMPVSYFNPDDTNGSAEGATLQREGLIYRVEDRQTIVASGLAQTLSHAFEMIGDSTRADVSRIETIWAPIERLSMGERYQAAAMAKNAGLANGTIRREVLQLTPRQMKAAENDDATDRLMMQRDMRAAAALAPQTQVPTRASALNNAPRGQR